MNKKITILLGLFCILVACSIITPDNNSTDISNKKIDLDEPVILEPTWVCWKSLCYRKHDNRCKRGSLWNKN